MPIEPWPQAQRLSDAYQAQVLCISDIPACTESTDIVISATASELPLIGKGRS
ncbi:hypothetical protein [Coxiella-like endosymbiont]|uniref:hypothetical protein n=1 Tax=Coxiella-like endosymbiont TaxID=1592897 RepID=UPI00272A5E94|nr:hypothetical protein [Coxiella-like endosymbiont]